ncbi:hypothetical protein RB597_004234 [Gaeumannomyces tritici]
MSRFKRQASAGPSVTPLLEAQEEDRMQYGSGSAGVEDDLRDEFANRPKNHSRTLVFSDLFTNLFNPLNENKKSRGPSGPPRRKTGSSKPSPHEQRRQIVERFIKRWRNEVGNDFYPALRLILPDKDRDRGVYGLRESAIGKLLVKLMKISSDSEDGHSLLRWKLPGQTFASRMAGDFAGRCFEILSKRQMRTAPGDMRIAEVNALLDRLSAASGEVEQLPIFQVFYERMNAEEMMWLVRIVLRQMKVGASERTFLGMWHPDGEALFSVSSSLRRVCWELYNPAVRLEQEDTGVTPMQCFQPQLAQFQMPESFERMITHMRPTDDDLEFWIEEKLDGERMQMHMVEDDSVPGGKRFRFWSRKGKDYTYLYGSSLEDGKSALTQHLGGAFEPRVRNLILDGEMVTWDPKLDKMVAFGTLKTAALMGQQMPLDESSERPLFRVFDILYLNDQPITQYTLRDRRGALDSAVRGVHRRLEIHPYDKATSHDAIEPLLRQVIADASEGLVLKNPRSMYRLNSRNDDWLKVKPEYMDEYGESLDCLVVGGYFGSGRRGGTVSSFLCGLRVGENHVKAGIDPEKCISFCKVGGGFKAEDYAHIRHLTEGKWMGWDASNPPSKYIELGGGDKFQYERPDVWIRPKDSVVISVKAASVASSDQFGMKMTLRFPRFRGLRSDRSWNSALDVDGFLRLREEIEQKAKEKTEMKIEDRRRPARKRARRELVIAGQDTSAAMPAGANQLGGFANAAAKKGRLFKGLTFCVLSESLRPVRQTKAQLEMLIKSHGGSISQKADPKSKTMRLIADKNVVKVASLIKQDGDVNVIRPGWIMDCVKQGGGGFVLPLEERHLLHAPGSTRRLAEEAIDAFGDSYMRDLEAEEIDGLLQGMGQQDDDEGADNDDMQRILELLGETGEPARGLMFQRCLVHCARSAGTPAFALEQLQNYVLFGGGAIADSADRTGITHIVVVTNSAAADPLASRELAAEMRYTTSSMRRPPRIVSQEWVKESWKEATRLDEEMFAPQ